MSECLQVGNSGERISTRTHMVTLIALGLVVAILWHFLLPRFWFACIGSTLSSAFLVWLLTMSHFGWMDATFFQSLAVTLAVALICSLVVGYITAKIRRAREAQP